MPAGEDRDHDGDRDHDHDRDGDRGHDRRDGDRDDPLDPARVVIPDDPRDLEADVRAYHHELLERRRRQRRTGLTARYRLTAGLVAGMLVLAVVSSSMSFLFTSRPQRRPPAPPVDPAPPGEVGEIGGLLPAARIFVNGRPRALRALRPAVLVLIPDRCGCDLAVRELTDQGREHGLNVYFVATRGSEPRVDALADTVGQGVVGVLEDPTGALERTYPASGLTAVLVHADGLVGGVHADLVPTVRLETGLAPLPQPGHDLLTSLGVAGTRAVG